MISGAGERRNCHRSASSVSSAQAVAVAGARRLGALPVRTVTKGLVDLAVVLSELNAFAALVLGGVLVPRIRIDDRPALRLLGPGDLFLLGAEPRTLLLAESERTACAGTKLALLEDRILIAARRWPRRMAGLLKHLAE
ncbi:MAG TPA: hypothetical protein VEF89_24035 [Solirubrobacteraceae bacterium]|nr:hypothetical protein [Solirubrobacteraceae bacterium]